MVGNDHHGAGSGRNDRRTSTTGLTGSTGTTDDNGGSTPTTEELDGNQMGGCTGPSTGGQSGGSQPKSGKGYETQTPDGESITLQDSE